MDTPLVCIIGYVWPEPTSSAAGVRMLQLIQSFIQHGFKVVFASAAQHSEHEFKLENIGVSTHTILLNDDSFNTFIKDLNPTYVLFDRYMIEEQFGWRVSENVPQAIKILDTEDLHFLRQARQKAYKQQVAIGTDLLQSDLAKREMASILRCDITLIISKFELDLLIQTYKIPKFLLCYLPIWFEPNLNLSKDFEDRKDFLFIGNFYHEPNRTAVFFLKEKIWPAIRKKLPQANLHIYGAYTDEVIRQLHHDASGFLVKGRAHEVQAVMQTHRVCLAPLQFGAGIKGKLLEAMKAQTPSITTTIGAEGIADSPDWPGFVCDDIAQMIEKSICLYTQPDLWRDKVELGNKILAENFNRSRVEPNLYEAINKIQQDLKQHRSNNFMGQILQHQTILSARYLSKYIMAKNKKAES